MARELTAEHKAAMQAGRERWEAEERAARLNAQADYSEWVREDARLWAIYLTASEALADDAERAAARQAWVDNLRRMPRLP